MDMEELQKRRRKLFTLAFILDGHNILLGLKKRGFGTGIWNGFGGKPLENETIVEAAVREIEEECGLKVEPKDLVHFAVNHFEFKDCPEIHEVHIFKCSRFQGDLKESDEMFPVWFNLTQRPRSHVWIDDELWYPLFLEGVRFRGYFVFEDFSKSCIEKCLIVDLDCPTRIFYSKNVENV
ncbi:unnamed protein product [Allacma fusca]|uniref:Nudix hydrolase domain-containing protein n=1 Tax=Allacma fusca TaxID=39272 RepID=A0A8J2P506_9HEXA|nr:unnamed protein product [Allacma fusca]